MAVSLLEIKRIFGAGIGLCVFYVRHLGFVFFWRQPGFAFFPVQLGFPR
jgi:hypothetical protein